ncbi:hypothetical protein LUZ60_009594 [Juncus effusus]|nr:hypothetical protein LUZ60_009594 [Juncus effusus]
MDVSSSLTARYSDWILEALNEIPDPFLITDPSISGHPIVFASQSFLAMSGYDRSDLIGRNARLFQGPDTDRRAVSVIREAVKEQRAVQISLRNYKKDGTPHWVLFHMCPVFGERDGDVMHFLAVQVPIGRRKWGGKRGSCSGIGGCRDELRMNDNYNHCADEVFEKMQHTVLDNQEACTAGEWEKERALIAASDIISALNRYSKVTGTVVCTRRICGALTVPALSASLNLSLGRIKKSFLLSDPNLPDMPIVYASDTFLSLTGYSRCEVLGRNCRFLNGPGSCLKALEEIKNSISAERSCTVRILNYRKDGCSFWNLFHISPVRNATGKIVYYVGVVLDEASKEELNGISPEIFLCGAVGAVRIAIRTFNSFCPGPSR